MNIKKIDGGIVAPKGFKASGLHCGIRKNKDKKDLALIYAECLCAAGAVYTTNKVQGAPIERCKKNMRHNLAQAIICNSGNANTCNADGFSIATQMCKSVADELKIYENDVLIASTGVIGQPLPLEPIISAMPKLVADLSDKKSGSDDAANAIMTTDTVKKEISIEFKIGETICKMGGIAKGSGMIHPNMATMLVFVTTDVAISPRLVQKAISEDVKSSFNMVSVDGDTSTNDTVLVLASGRARNKEIAKEDEDYQSFCEALNYVTTYLCKEIAKDGEGATKMIICNTLNASDITVARTVAKSVITSSLFKAAIFGKDANWGRILCAIGYADCDFDINKIDVSLGSSAGKVDVCQDGHGILFSEEKALEILQKDEIIVDVNMNSGNESATAWGCDLTYDYVKINGDYRT